MPITNYIWDTVNDSYLMEIDGSHNITNVFTQEPGPYGGLISQRQANVSSYYHFDMLGSTRLRTNSTESIVESTVYDSWGNIVSPGGGDKTLFGFIGRFGYAYDSECGTYYIRARTYSPLISRWLSTDPAHFVDGINLYAMTSVLTGSDPSGTRNDGEVPDYTTGDVSACQAMLRTIVNAQTNSIIGAYVINAPCANALLTQFLSKSGGTSCPAACKSALTSELAAHFGSTEENNALVDSLFIGCGKNNAKTWSDETTFQGTGVFSSGDLLYAFQAFSFSFQGAAHLVCNAGAGKPCCCDCKGGATLDGNVTDPYDFCSSLKGKAQPHWKSNKSLLSIGGWKPTPDELAWCGCVLEDYFNKQTALGFGASDIVGGATFTVNCPIHLDVTISRRCCEK
ncbi:MAG: wapA5 [Planctomycetaceae bacterium]|nr:wapA5 [Planctomycetaceae bacterium]